MYVCIYMTILCIRYMLHNLTNMYTRVIYICASLSYFYFLTCVCEICIILGSKTSWYHLKDTLPAPAWHFISSSVKKNSWLPKRIYRLCEFFLSNEFDIFDASDWGLLQKKFKTLIIDYVVRVAGTLMGGSDAAMKTSSPVDKR